MNVYAFMAPGPLQMLIILMLGVLFFGKRLPEVGRSLGQSLMEFKRGVGDYKDESTKGVAEPERAMVLAEEEEETGAKFEPPSL